MDNITHSLLGFVIGESFAKRLDKSRGPIVAASVLANNFPDLDFLYAPHLSKPFGNLLHHRGHTHTVLGALGCSILVWLFVNLVLAARKTPMTRKDNALLIFVSCIGTLTHILLDSFNTYGVHPFWPIDNTWHYGDTLFIIEPTLWIFLPLSLLSCARRKVSRAFFGLLPLVAFALIFMTGYVPPIVGVGILVLTFLFIVLSRGVSQNARFLFGLAGGAFCFSSFLIMGSLAARALPPPEKRETLLADFLLPHPANPFCWGRMQMKVNSDMITYQRSMIQPLSRWFSLPCEQYSLFFQGREPAISEIDEQIPLSLFHENNSNCRWRAFLQFSRVPMIGPCESSPGLCSNDMRFRRFGRKGFTSLPLEGDCPNALPPWEGPTESPLTSLFSDDGLESGHRNISLTK